MTFNDLLAIKGYTVYSLSKNSGIARTTVFDIASGKTDLQECTGRTLKILAKALEVSIEELLELEKENLKDYPQYLATAIDKVQKSLKKESTITNIYIKQLYECIDIALNDNLISKDDAKSLKERFKLS